MSSTTTRRPDPRSSCFPIPPLPISTLGHHAFHEPVHVDILSIVGDEELVATWIRASREAVAVELVSGLDDDVGTGIRGADVGAVDILDVAMDRGGFIRGRPTDSLY